MTHPDYKGYKPQVNELKPYGTRCFFTGLECEWPTKKERKNRGGFRPLEATVEHLIPLSLCKFRVEGNYVVASRVVNNMIGNAPLSVKYEVRDALQSVIIPHYFTPEKKTETIKSVVSHVLSKYLIAQSHRDYVWNWKGVCPTKTRIRGGARQRYLKLLTEEEYMLDSKYNGGKMTEEA